MNTYTKTLIIGGIFITVLAPISGSVLIAAGAMPGVLEPLSDATGVSSEGMMAIFITAGTILWVFMGLGILMIVGGALIPLFSSLSKNKSIMSQGIAADAKILSIEETGTLINNNPVCALTLEVQPTSAPKFTAKAKQTISLVHLASHQPGMLVEVKYQSGTHDAVIVGPKMK